MTEKNPNEYPLMLYLGGDTANAHVIVEDAEGEKIAKEGGFLRHGETADLAGGTPLTAKELKDLLREREIPFAGNASREVLQGLYEAAIAKDDEEEEEEEEEQDGEEGEGEKGGKEGGSQA